MRFWIAVACLVAAPAAYGQTRLERSAPDVGVEVEADVGRPIMTLERVYQAPAIRLEAPVTTFPWRQVKISVQLPAGLYTLVKTTPKGRFFQSQAGVTMVHKDKSRAYPNGGILLPSDGGAPLAYVDENTNVSAEAPGAIVKDAGLEEIGTDGFRIQLLYGGVSKGTVTLSYREFMNDLARPGFSQELTYDLADGDEIGFRGARLKILKANNVSIRYVVVKPLSAPR